MTLNVNEIKEESESKYLVLQPNTTTSVTFVTDDKKMPKTANRGTLKERVFYMREFQVRTSDGLIKTLSFFTKDAKNLLEIVAKNKGVMYADLTTIVDVKVEVIISLDANNKEVLDFRVMA